MNRALTEQEAYLAMFIFLERRYRRMPSDEIGILLGELSLLSDGGSADPAALEDWREAVTAVRSGEAAGRAQ